MQSRWALPFPLWFNPAPLVDRGQRTPTPLSQTPWDSTTGYVRKRGQAGLTGTWSTVPRSLSQGSKQAVVAVQRTVELCSVTLPVFSVSGCHAVLGVCHGVPRLLPTCDALVRPA